MKCMNEAIKKANQYIKDNKDKVNTRYRHHYHLMGQIGWINDPNGFSLYQNDYHLFYQYHPYSSSWGPMHWGHATSKDLIEWQHLDIALGPLGITSEEGNPFSGSAITVKDKHYLMYTENWPYRQIQNIASSIDGVQYHRESKEGVITSENLKQEDSKVDFRDPKIIEKDGVFYALIANRAKDQSGQILLYKSKNLLDWSYVNSILKSHNKIGEMWECPDLFSLDEKDILLVSPQYMKTQNNDFSNLHSSIYMIGAMDYEIGAYKCEYCREIDAGLDFYAPQTMIDQEGRRIMIAWMGMWERSMPTNQLNHKWAGSMTLPRILEMKDGKLVQKPIDSIETYRKNHERQELVVSGQVDTNMVASVAELDISVVHIDALSFSISLFKGEKEETKVTYLVKEELLVFDRSMSGHSIVGNLEHEENSNKRQTKVALINERLDLRIFLDKSSVEIFIQGGSKTMTSLVYPKEDSIGLSLSSNQGSSTFIINKWDLEVT